MDTRRSEGGVRVILLGASNLTRCLTTAVGTTERLLGSPGELWLACGHGRSYGIESSVLARRLPGILPSGLWQRLEREPDPVRTYALLTDIGNDIVYDVPVAVIGDWLEEILVRLRAQHARITVTDLPLASLRRLRPWKYRLVRRLLFPSCRLSLVEALQRCDALSARLQELAERFGAALVPTEPDWYGFDAIHLRRSAAPSAWARFVSSWEQTPAALEPGKTGLLSSLRLRSCRAEDWRLLGMRLGSSQPAARLARHTSVFSF